jgi:NAD+ kinase
MTSTIRSPQPSGKPLRRARLFLRERHGFEGAIERVHEVASEAGVEIADDAPELVIVLGGDGTMLRAFHEFLGRGVPVIGVNFGRFGFLASMQPDELEEGLRRVFAGDYAVLELPTLDFEHAGGRSVAVNDVVAAGRDLGRMVEIEWAIGGEPLGTVPCDAVIVSTPCGSTAYNLSNNGPVLMWGIDALAVSFVAPHSLTARPLVVPRGRDVVITNRTTEGPLALISDGSPVGEIAAGGDVTVRLGDAQVLLATLPDATFLTRFRSAFAYRPA